MSTIEQKEFDRNLTPRERRFGFPRIALRQRSAEHPMIMFFMVVATAFTAMALVPPAGSAFASIGVSAAAVADPAIRAEEPATTSGLSEIEITCSGQAWGAENAECLAAIAKDSGRNDARQVRLIADADAEAEAQTAIPNVF